jgi:hypothetical protein
MASPGFKIIGALLKGKKKADEEEEEDDLKKAQDAAISLDATDSTPKWNAGDHATLRLDGIGDVVVPRGDMSDEDWNGFINDAKAKQKLRGETVVETVEDKAKAAETGKSGYEARPKSDYMEVYVGKGRGETAVVPRGDMDETTWNALKNRAKKMGVFRGSNDTIKEKIQNAESIVSNPELEKRVGPMSESTGMEDGIEPTQTPQQMENEAKDLNQQKKDTEDLEVQRAEGGAPGIKGFVQRGLTSAAPQSRGTVEIGDAEIGSERALNKGMSRQLGKAATSQQDQRAVVENALAPVRAAGEAALAGTQGGAYGIGQGAREFLSTSPLTQGARFGMAAAGMAKEGLGELAQDAGTFAAGLTGAPPPKSDVMVPPPAPQSPARAPDATGMPAQAPVQTGAAPGMGSMSMKAGMQTSGAPNVQLPKDRTAEIDAAYSQGARAQMAQADLQAKGLEQKRSMFEAGLNEDVRQQARLGEVTERKRVALEKPMQIYSQMVTELQQPTQKVDPHRWWNSRSTGQKIMLALGALLTKGGNIQAVQHAIDADIGAQQSDISNDLNRKKTLLGASENMIQMIRANGADEVQSIQLYRALSWDMVAKRLEMVAANTDSQTVKLKAEQNIAESNVKRNQVLNEMERYTADLEIRKMNAEREWAESSWRSGGGGPKTGKVEKIKGPQLTKIAALKSAIGKLDQLSRSYGGINSGAMGGFPEAGVNALTRNLPKTGAARFDYDAQFNLSNIGTELNNAGVIQPGEVARFEKMNVKSSDPDTPFKLRSMREDLQRRLSDMVKTFEAAGYGTEGQLPPEVSTFEPDEAAE